MALSHLSFFVIGLMMSLHLVHFWMPWAVFIGIFHLVFFTNIWGQMGMSTIDYFLLLPLTGTFGITIGYCLADSLNLRRLLFLNRWREYGYWVPICAVQLALMHAVLLFWELDEVFGTPTNWIVTLVAYILLIPLLYLMNRGARVFLYRDDKGVERNDDNAAEWHYGVWAVFQVFAVLVFLVVEVAFPSFNPFFTALIVFGIEFLAQWLLGIMASQYEWKIRASLLDDSDAYYTPDGSNDLVYDASRAAAEHYQQTSTTVVSNAGGFAPLSHYASKHD